LVMLIFVFLRFPRLSRMPIKRPCLFLLARLGKPIDIENGAKCYDIITAQNGLRSPAVFILSIFLRLHSLFEFRAKGLSVKKNQKQTNRQKKKNIIRERESRDF
jgi:hypothetical protein